MSKLTEALTMTRAQRRGMAVVLLLLLASLLWLWKVSQETVAVTSREVAAMEDFKRTSDSLLLARQRAESPRKPRRNANRKSSESDTKTTSAKAASPAKVTSKTPVKDASLDELPVIPREN